MSFTAGVTSVNGINVPTMYDRTSGKVSHDFQSYINTVQNFLIDVVGPPPTAPTAAQLADLQNAIQGLRDLATKGEINNVDPSNPSSPLKQYYLTIEMAQSVDLLFRSLSAAGVQIPTTGDITITQNQAELWQVMSAASPLARNAFDAALQSLQNNASLQSMIELVYIGTANRVLGEKLGDLEKALKTTEDVLKNLSNIQDLHNQIQIHNSTFKFSYQYSTGDGNDYVTRYRSAASAFFGSPIAPSLSGDYYSIPPYLMEVFTQMVSPTTRYATSSEGGVNTLTFNGTAPTPPEFLTHYGLKATSDPNVFTLSDGDLANLNSDTNTMYQIVNGSGRGHSYIPWNNNAMSSGQLYIDPNSSLNSKIQEQWGLTKPVLTSQIEQLVKYRNQLSAQIAALSASSPSASLTDPNSLYGTLKAVLADIKSVFTTADGRQVTASTSLADAYAGFQSWMEDSYNMRNTTASGSSGKIQQDITAAITAGQSLNTTQQESVRQFMYVFEEYYKSAAAILKQITEIIERIAQGIGR